MIEKALILCSNTAARAHDGTYRKDKETPGIVHSGRVAAVVRGYGGTVLAQCVAWMHDVLEDRPDFDLTDFFDELQSMLSVEDIRKFNQMLEALTKNPDLEAIAKNISEVRPVAERRLARDKETYERILKAPPEATLIKICDRIDNLHDLIGFDSKFIVRYIQETYFLIEMLKPRAERCGYELPMRRLEKIVAMLKDFQEV